MHKLYKNVEKYGLLYYYPILLMNLIGSNYPYN